MSYFQTSTILRWGWVFLPLMSALPLSAQEAISSDDVMAQVTGVSQLQDVSPGDWAFEALRNLSDRYDCLAGYPDFTFRGNRPLTRYEFAAALNSCLQRYEQIIAENLRRGIPREELVTIRRLQEEFALEFAILRGSIDAAQTRIRELELTQFSATTQLRGDVFLNFTNAFTGGDILAEGERAFRAQTRSERSSRREGTETTNLSLGYTAFLTLNSSLTGQDNLTLQLAAGNGNSPANRFASAGLFNTYGVPFTEQTPALEAGDVVIREFAYRFPLSDRLQATVGPRINWYRYFDNNRYTNVLTGASSFNSTHSPLLNAVDRGSGAVLSGQLGDNFSFNLGYLGENAEFLPFNTASNPQQGLFGGTNTLTTELVYSPTQDLNLRFLYNRSNLAALDGQVGGAAGRPIYGFADDGRGGDLANATADTFSFNFDWQLARNLGLFGRYTYASTQLNPLNPAVARGTVNAQSVQLGVAFPDLGRTGALATVSYVLPFSVIQGREFLVSGGGDGGVQYELEATYFYPVSDNFAIVPAFYFIGNANNFSGNPNIYVTNLRAQFNF